MDNNILNTHQESQNKQEEVNFDLSNNKKNNKWKLAVAAIVLIILAVITFFWQRNKKEINENIINNRSVEPIIEQSDDKDVVIAKGKIYFLPAEKVIKTGDEFEVDILADTEGMNINAVSLKIEFDPQKLELIKVDADKSVLTMSAIKKIEGGLIEIVRGQSGDGDINDSDDGFTGNGGNLVSMVFRAQKTGETRLKFIFKDTSLLLDDGRGTAMAVDLGEGKYIIE